MVRINLLPVRQIRKRAQLIRNLRVGTVILVAAVVALLFLYSGKQREVRQLRTELAGVQQELDRLAAQDVTRKANTFRRKKKELESKLGVIASLKVAQKAPVHILDDLSRRLPDHVWLSSIRQGGGEILVDGFAFSNVQVARYMESLEAADYFDGVELLTAATTMEANQPVVRFSFRMREVSPNIQQPGEQGG